MDNIGNNIDNNIEQLNDNINLYILDANPNDNNIDNNDDTDNNDSDVIYQLNSDMSGSFSNDNTTDIQVNEKMAYGCEHYLRKCKIMSPCCNKIYPCRLCHDEENYELVTDIKIRHKIDRFAISQVICTECDTFQNIKRYCEKCGVCFGKYCCDICHLFDDTDKKQFHCNGCGFCRIGGAENITHCDICNMCVPLSVFDNHKCLNIMDSSCPICMTDLFTSTIGVTQLDCGHYIHKTCLIELLKSSYKCPLCFHSIIVVDEYNKLLDEEIGMFEMPDEYKDMMVQILCNDCHGKTMTNFHVIGLKCHECGGYNTRRI